MNRRDSAPGGTTPMPWTVSLADASFSGFAQDGVIAYCRGRRANEETPLLAQAAAPLHEMEAAIRLNNEYALRGLLDPSWSLPPKGIVTSGGCTWLLYDDIDAAPLNKACAGRLEVGRFLERAIAIVRAVRGMHGRGILHRDIKPVNFLIDARGACRIMGFGMASTLSPADAREAPEAPSGSLAYLSPEHAGYGWRHPDSRSDLYSLGVVLYEMLTGHLPVDLHSDARGAQWMHRHPASEPDVPHRLFPDIPPVLSSVVLRLLARNPECRYQTAAGLENDLKRCQRMWTTLRRMDDFPLGTREEPAELVFPERLYAREAKLQKLAAVFDRVSGQRTRAMAVMRGESGVGKSALLAAFAAQLRQRGVCVALGKVDQYRRDLPYAALAEALDGLVMCLAAQPESALRYWRDRLQRALGDYALLAVNLVPSLARFVGTPPAVPDLPAFEAQARFHAVMLRLMSAFAAAGHPLVLMIDDLQWIDSSSMRLLDYVMRNDPAFPLMLLVACRSDPAGLTPSFPDWIALLRQRAAEVHEYHLSGLNVRAVERLIAEVLGRSNRESRELARLVHGKTHGNPLFVRQFMKAIADDGLMARDAASGHWHADLDGIREHGYTDNVAELVLEGLLRMPSETRVVLAGLACLGHQAPAAMLARIHQRSAEQIRAGMEPALDAAIVHLGRDGYRFCHDRVQEAAYLLIDERQRRELHLAMGRVLLDAAMADGRDDDWFRAFDHLTLAGPDRIAPAQRQATAAAGLTAARKARRAIAYPAALACIDFALSLIAAEEGAPLTYSLMLEQADCLLNSGKPAAARAVVDRLTALPASRIDRAAAFRLKVETHLRLSENALAVSSALAGLRDLGIDIAPHPTAADCEDAYRRVRTRLTDDPAAVLLALAPMRNAEIEAAMSLLAVLSAPAGFADDRLHFLQLCHTLELTLLHGMTGAATAALGWFGVLVGHRFGKYEEGYVYGQLARTLVARHRYPDYEARTLLPLDQLSVWTRPLSFSIDCAKAGFAAGVANGDVTTACFECCHQVANLLARGDHLDLVRKEAERGLSFVRHAGFPDVEAILVTQMRFIDILRGADDAGLSGDALSPDVPQQAGGQGGERMPTLFFWFWLYKAILHFLAAEPAEARHSLREAGRLAWSAPGHIHLLDFHLFSALTLAEPSSREDEAANAIAAIAPHHEQIAAWAALNPDSFADKAALLRAELARLRGDRWAALGAYDEAIRHAEAQGAMHYAAYAHERAAALCQAAGLRTAAEAHLTGARNRYGDWGAAAKVRLLDQSHPGRPAASLSASESGESRDMASVIRSVRALSEEIDLDNLISVLLTMTLRHAGAQRGLLFLLDGGMPFVAAQARNGAAGVQVDLTRHPPRPDESPLSLLDASMRTLQRVGVAGDAHPSPFLTDPYLRRYPQCAAMCIPLIKRSELVGVLYLEHRRAPNAFTAEQARVLEIMAAQAAISLDVARLYADLVQENAQRRKVESALRTSEATLELGERISHTGSWYWKVEKDIITCSSECCRILGRDPAQRQVSFTEFIRYVLADDRSMVLDTVRSHMLEQQAFQVDYRIARADGTIRYLSGVGKPAFGEGESSDYVGTVTDITVRRAGEDALRIAQAELARVARTTTVGQLTASIAHEISQPLMSIVANGGASLRWLRRDPPEIDEARAGLEDIVSEAGRAGHIIQSLQALTRNAEPVMRELDLHATIRHILAIARSEIERRGVSVQLALDAQAHEVYGDAIGLQQVLLNLVVNAIDAMSEVDDRPRMLSVTSRNDDDGIEVHVGDTGTGIRADARNKVFEAFYTTKQNGMGMGLAICRSIIDAHHGRLWMEAGNPFGCTFSFILPVLPR